MKKEKDIQEFIEKTLDDYKKEWDSDPSSSSEISAFRQGVSFAYNYLLKALKSNNSWIYEEEDYSALCYHDKKEIENMTRIKEQIKDKRRKKNDNY